MNNEAWYLTLMPYEENYKAAKKRIDNAQTVAELEKVDAGLTRCARAGCFLDDDYGRLDKTLLKKLIEAETKSWETH